MSPFVGFKEVSEEELKNLLQKLSTPNSYYFMRSPSHVSGIVKSLEEFPTPEGQMFDRELELRWKKQPSGYSVLLLTTKGERNDFTRLGEEWEVKERPAYGYHPDETRFPKSRVYTEIDVRISDKNQKGKPKLAQRYFIDARTATVHFVALTLE